MPAAYLSQALRLLLQGRLLAAQLVGLTVLLLLVLVHLPGTVTSRSVPMQSSREVNDT